MLRMYFLQHWFNRFDPAVEETLYDSPTMRAFVGIDLGREPAPDETTVCWHRLLGRLVSEYGRLCHGAGGPRTGRPPPEGANVALTGGSRARSRDPSRA